MNNKKKQTAVVAMATVLSVTSIASPLPVMAQEDTPAPPAIMQEENGQQKTAPDISLPKNLQATAGTALEEITLPEHWSWEEKSTVITTDTTEYPARFSADDVTYDYSDVEGYNAEGHYVECMVTVTVEPAKLEPAEPVQEKSNRSLGYTLTAVNAGDIEINDTNFPDKGFRDWLEQQSYGQDKKITQNEIAGITEINVSNYTDIDDLTGIKHFTALTTLQCYTTGITALDVSYNTKLTTLYCYNTGISDLDVSNNTQLTSLYCDNTEISDLNLSNNTKLTTLNCSGTGISVLDVSNNTALTSLTCNNTGISDLNLSNNTKLTSLICNNTGISDLNLSNNAALTSLTCNNTEISDLNLSNNTALTTLYCYNTGITALDVSSNTALTTLICYNTGISVLDVSNNTALTSLNCSSNAKLANLTVAGATELTTLNCNSNAKLANLTVAGATKLTTLYCNNTGISDLDVSQNAKLITLSCQNNAKLANLTVAGATDLLILSCQDTGITSLDVSQNAKLVSLDCYNTPLAYLNIGTNGNLGISKDNLKPVSLEIAEDSFNMADKFIGINVSKITNVSGAVYKDGIMSNYDEGTPITYTYDCGTAYDGAETIDVTLNLTDTRGDSTISITENLSKTYDKTAVNAAPNVNKTGSSGTVSFTWDQKKNAADWEQIAFAPTDAGTYRVTANLASDNNYKGATSAPVEFTISQADSTISITENLSKTYDKTAVNATPNVNKTGSSGTVSFTWDQKKSAADWEQIASAPTDAGTYRVTATLASDSNCKGATTTKEFTISQAVNSWTDTLSIAGWTYGNTANEPTATATFGKASYLYSDSENGTYTDTAPTNTGTWYVKAVVAGTDNYESLEGDAVSFVIAPKNITSDSQITVPEITADTNLDELVIKDGDVVLVQGTDYDVARTQDGNKVTVTITFKGNYTGTITRSYIVEEKTPAGGDKDDNKSDGTKTDDQNTGDKKAVETGDTTSLGLWSSLLAFSAGIAVFLKRKKQQEETEE